jgi:lysyl-tRNA synthetase class 1
VGTVLQTCDGNIAAARDWFRRQGQLQSDEAVAAFERRAACVWRWIERYAPEDFRYRIRSEPVTRAVEGPAREGLVRLCAILEAEPDLDEKALGARMKALAEDSGLDLEGFYPVVYDLLLGRDRGPKLTSLLTTMGAERALALLRPSTSV